MPSLQWIGKEAVLNHHREVPYRLLKCEGELSHGAPGSGNLLVEGDNLEALKALLPYYRGTVKCIYIDPPYNTGKENWAYNDNVNSPEIKRWLKQVVDKEKLDRHDRWLCMMWPRLKLLWEFLTTDGVILMSLDNNELSHALVILDAIFGASNFLGCIVWKNVTDNNPTRIATEHEYILVYAKHQEDLPAVWKSLTDEIQAEMLQLETRLLVDEDEEQVKKSYSAWYKANKNQLGKLDNYKHIDQGGIYAGSRSVHNPGKQGYSYDVMHPASKKPVKVPLMGWRFPRETMDELLAAGRIIFGEDESKLIEIKTYLRDYRAKLPSVIELDGRAGTNEFKQLFPEQPEAFDHAKPSALMTELLSYVADGQTLVLDSFAGSGTTGQAVTLLNGLDKGSRRFILVEMDAEIARGVTRERLARSGATFRYCTLGETLFDANGMLSGEVTRQRLAHHIWFTETGEPLPEPVRTGNPVIGSLDGVTYCLFDGCFDLKALRTLPPTDGERVVYADSLRVTQDRLRQERITFKRIPYEVRES